MVHVNALETYGGSEFVTMSIQLFVNEHLASKKNDEPFLQDFLEILKYSLQNFDKTLNIFVCDTSCIVKSSASSNLTIECLPVTKE